MSDRARGGRTPQDQEKTNEDGDEDAGDHTEYYEGPSPRPEPHIEALIMQQTVEACAVGMVRIAPSCHSHRETCQTAEPRGPEIPAVRTLDVCPCRIDAGHRCDGLTGTT